jgi:type IV pilus assembly protein PilE
MKRFPVRARGHAGFTLIDLLAGVSIAGVLATVAYPSFEAQVQKARRTDALVALMNVQMAEERWRANAATYGSLAEIGIAGQTASGHYTVTIDTPTADGYAAIASAGGAQMRDASCRYLKLTVAGGNATQASGPDSTVSNGDTANRRCWGQG